MVKEKKVVLYNPRPNPNLRPVDIPLALLSVSKILDKEGYEIKIISENLYHQHFKEALNHCSGAICFGVTAMTGYQIIDGLKISKLLKHQYPELPIVWGGWHPSLESVQTVSHPAVDIVVKGQGERTFTELVHALEDGLALDNILGITYKEKERVVNNSDRRLENINNFPPIPYHLVDIEKCLFATEFGDRTTNYVSSQGCPYRCGFCCEQTVNKRAWTGLNVQRVVDDIERLVSQYGVNGLSINDSSFFVNKERVRKICQEIIRRKIKIKWGNVNGRTRQLTQYDDELWRLLEESGCYSILTGAESGYQPALDLIHKDILVKDNIEFGRKCSHYHIKVVYSFLTGLPWPKRNIKEIKEMTDKEIESSLDLIDKLLAMDTRHRALLFNYTPYPGTPLYQKSLDLGLKPPSNLEGWGKFTLYQSQTPWVTSKQEKFIKFLSSYVFFFLDSDTCDWVSLRIPNRHFRQLFIFIFRSFAAICKFRWRHRFFKLRFDYWVLLLFKKFNKWV
ncbi:MAG TPA: B12-binding domain-containing radical SAM protein [Candidatus Scalindua sp.]|nr:B12-binding domain-containing radical SAM protein [Candidatus Scalindua sp.]